jgi:putative transposase
LSIHAYVLMTNHFHLLVTPSAAGSLPRAMQTIGGRYVPYFNERYRRTGGLFEGRYRSTVVTDERYLMTCMRYIELNPVRAGLVMHPASYRWSSYRTHTRGDANAVLTAHEVYTRLGLAGIDRRRAWQAFCSQGVPDAELHELRADVARGAPLTVVTRPADDGAETDRATTLSRLVTRV